VVLLVCRAFAFKESLLEGLDPYSIQYIYHVLLEELGCRAVQQQWGAPAPARGWDAEQWNDRVKQGAFAPVSSSTAKAKAIAS
jgi:hypothetical protein